MDNRSANKETSESLAARHNRSTSNSNYRQKKRKPTPTASENDIYVTSRSNFQGQYKQVLKLFENGSREVIVHGLGAAVVQAANLSLQVAEKLNNTVVLSANTDTVELVDDWEPFADEDLPYTTKRLGSALHITITRHPDFPS